MKMSPRIPVVYQRHTRKLNYMGHLVMSEKERLKRLECQVQIINMLVNKLIICIRPHFTLAIQHFM